MREYLCVLDTSLAGPGFTNPEKNGILKCNCGRKEAVRMKGYRPNKRALIVRVTAAVLAVLMILTVFSALIFR